MFEGDFPNLERFVESIREFDFTKFPKTDLKFVHQPQCNHSPYITTG